MEKTLGQRIKECRLRKGMTQENMAEALLTKKSTISAYENDKIDIKISVLKETATVLDTSVFYLVGEQEDISNDVMQTAMILQQFEDKKLRKAAIDQIKLLLTLDID